MILICDICHARYLVPATHFAGGPRRVRCARCGKEWMAGLPQPEKAEPAPEVEEKKIDTSITQEKEPIAQVTEKAADKVKKKEPSVPPVLKVSGFIDPPSSVNPIPEGSGLPAVWRDPFWTKLWAVISVTAVLFVFLVLLWGIVDRNRIVRIVPEIEPVYALLHLHLDRVGDDLAFTNVVTERTEDQGHIQLVVTGEIKNASKKTIKIPKIIAAALKADGTAAKLWSINPEVPEIAGGAVLSFKSTEDAPEEAVTEVTLSFDGDGTPETEEDAD